MQNGFYKTPTARGDAKVTLRKGKILRFKNEDIVLLQFDPNFMSNEVVCHHPSCQNTNLKAAKRVKDVKRDLYLCPNHQEVLKSRVCEAMEKEKIQFPLSEFAAEPVRFEGYTEIISLLDRAFHETKKVPTIKTSSRIVEEAILNVRNFLITTSTVINPDFENLALVLPPVLQILPLILQSQGAIEKIRSLLPLLREVIEIISQAFGVIFTWVSLANPGTKIGAGLGGCIGAVGLALGPATGAAGVAVGMCLGSLIGSGAYLLHRENKDQQNTDRARREWLEAGNANANQGAVREPPVMYSVSGDVWGQLIMCIILYI